MRVILIILLFLYAVPCLAQNGEYILFEDRPPFDTISLPGYKLLYNRVELETGEGKPSLEILNTYFSRNNFISAGLDRKAFVAAEKDQSKLQNDVLITLTPLTDSIKNKSVKISNEEFSHLAILKPEQLLQEATKNLFRCFSENDVQRSDIPGVIKSNKYKLIIKRHNNYYKISAPVLTEFYLVDRANYLFPNQYHYGEINVSPKGYTNYFNGQDIDSILHQNHSSNSNGYYREKTISRRTFLSKVKMTNNVNIYTYWTYPVFTIGPIGIGEFEFVEGIGIINGSFPYFFDKNYLTTLENNRQAAYEDFNGSFRLNIKAINGLDFKEYTNRIRKAKNTSVIIPGE